MKRVGFLVLVIIAIAGMGCPVEPATNVTPTVKYTVTFNQNTPEGVEVTGMPLPQTVNSGGLVKQPANAPERDDYIFDGWYKEYTCQNRWVFATDTVNEDTILYADWKIDSTEHWAVTYYGIDGIYDERLIPKTPGATTWTVPRSTRAPDIENWEFIYWSETPGADPNDPSSAFDFDTVLNVSHFKLYFIGNKLFTEGEWIRGTNANGDTLRIIEPFFEVLGETMGQKGVQREPEMNKYTGAITIFGSGFNIADGGGMRYRFKGQTRPEVSDPRMPLEFNRVMISYTVSGVVPNGTGNDQVVLSIKYYSGSGNDLQGAKQEFSVPTGSNVYDLNLIGIQNYGNQGIAMYYNHYNSFTALQYTIKINELYFSLVDPNATDFVVVDTAAQPPVQLVDKLINSEPFTAMNDYYIINLNLPSSFDISAYGGYTIEANIYINDEGTTALWTADNDPLGSGDEGYNEGWTAGSYRFLKNAAGPVGGFDPGSPPGVDNVVFYGSNLNHQSVRATLPGGLSKADTPTALAVICSKDYHTHIEITNITFHP